MNENVDKRGRNSMLSIYMLFVLCIVAAMCAVGCKRLDKADEGVASEELTEVRHSGEGNKVGDYWVVDRPTPNIAEGRNEVKAVVLHHTATDSIEQSLDILTNPDKGVSCHVLIDKDGTRYVLAPPDSITWHAGRSRLNGRENVNRFAIGIEFQGNTVEEPLTEAQIQSAIDYLLPILDEYKITDDNIVTHEQIRANYIKAHPRTKTPKKVDVTPDEHTRFMQALQVRRDASD